ncbi:MAG: hypothetical protein NZ700_13040 [Gemmataceae bacterium]|nr:hypothetical protein [Gemmataceae bacterium]MDW8266256.1 cytochrome c peroxidase [Gemmataceae bacterium]
MRKLGTLLVGLILGIAIGCEPAGRYPVKSPIPARLAPSPAPAPPPTAAERPTPLPFNYAWMDADPAALEQPIPIRFLSRDTDPAGWDALPKFWNETLTLPSAGSVALLIGLDPLPAALLAVALPWERSVRVKVPLGLGDPTPLFPTSNPPTLGKWELGKQLFFDPGWLAPDGPTPLSCAGCHEPEHGFAGPPRSVAEGRRSTPTLFNVAYNRFQFWDGRVEALEQVVQQSLEDERPTAETRSGFHSWPGVVQRLRDDRHYDARFRRVFGTRPTQDAIGKAVATYLRTILVGGSVHDRAERVRRQRAAAELEPRDYEAVLDRAALERLGREPGRARETAQELFIGYQLFHGKARCATCHGGPNFTDAGFHNIGVGESALSPVLGQETGRFAALPVGLKDARMIGAYKTPTLRGLPRRRFFFHDGSRDELRFVIASKTHDIRLGPHLDQELRDPLQPVLPRRIRLEPNETEALVLFLKALDGEPVDPVVARRD